LITQGKTVLSGGLGFIGLADLFQILGGNNSTGTLHLKNQYAAGPGVIYFVDGNPVNAASGSLHGLDAIRALFGWTDGTFEFHEEKVNAGRAIEHGRMQIVLDALRLLDDGLIERVGPPSFDDVSDEKKGRPRVIRRPIIDYMLIINEEEIPDGTDIVKEGAHGKWIWIILEGIARVNRETIGGPLTIVSLGEGSFIGNLNSFLHSGSKRSATVTAVGKVRLGLLDSDQIYEEFSSLSSEFRTLLASLAGRLDKITDRFIEVSSGKNEESGLTRDKEVIMNKGSEKEGLFTITEGEAWVVGHAPKGSLTLFRLEKGDVFGHVPFMDMGLEPYSASVVASKDLKFSQLDVHGLQETYSRASGTFRSLMDHVCTCISVTTRRALDLRPGSRPSP
jgi:CRP-like cAMP-binding protein